MPWAPELFTYDADAAALLLARTLRFLDRVAPG